MQDLTIALVGNPNVGKSTVFNGLTGLRQHTGNWPGKTVGMAAGNFVWREQRCTLVDLPGTYSLSPHSAEEAVTRDYLDAGRADAVCVVCDATCLERNLILALQVIARYSKVLVCVNLLDEADRRGIRVDTEALSRALGVPVVGISARRKQDLDRLRAALLALPVRAAAPHPEGDPVALAAEIAARVSAERWPRQGEPADRILTGRVTAFPVMLLLLALVLWLTIWGANSPSALLSRFFTWSETLLAQWFDALGAAPWLRGALVHGMWRTLGWVVSVMLPPMAIFFPLFTLLEDLGYLPRVAFNLDRCFRCAHACGKQSLTMLMGFGCNAAGVTGCRIIDSPRERLIAILTNSFVPCNGRFPAMITLCALFFAGSSLQTALLLTGVILLGVACTLLASRLLSATVLKGQPSSFTLELPPYRPPQVGKLLLRSLVDRSLFVLGRAVAVAAPAGLVIWLLANLAPGSVPILTRLALWLEPLARPFGLDGAILLAFFLALPASEILLPLVVMVYTASGLLTEAADPQLLGLVLRQNGWTQLTALNTVLFSLFHWPCSTTLLTIRKEAGGWRWAALAFLLPTAFGLLLCRVTVLLFG